MSNYLPTKDLELQKWVDNFVAIAQANASALGIGDSDLLPIQGEDNQFTQALAALQIAKTAYDGAAKNKEQVHKALVARIRPLVKKIQATTYVPATLKTQLGINANTGPRTKTPPVTPSTLVAVPLASGTNTLAWKKMGNKATTQYVVYAKPLTAGTTPTADTGWMMVGQTTRSKFDHRGVTPGQPFAYKVVAARADQTSQPTAPVVVYGG